VLHWLKTAFTGHPELAIFLTMAIGFFGLEKGGVPQLMSRCRS
jgi:hypothetical protein